MAALSRARRPRVDLYSEWLFWEALFQKWYPKLAGKREVLSAAQLNAEFDRVIEEIKRGPSVCPAS